jgi:hypothetical protein
MYIPRCLRRLVAISGEEAIALALAAVAALDAVIEVLRWL